LLEFLLLDLIQEQSLGPIVTQEGELTTLMVGLGFPQSLDQVEPKALLTRVGLKLSCWKVSSTLRVMSPRLIAFQAMALQAVL
jgi:hypothetical protein